MNLNANASAARIFLLANFTVESVAMRIKSAQDQEQAISFNVQTAAGFDTWRMELLNPDSQVWSSSCDSSETLVFVLLHGAALLATKRSAGSNDLENVKAALDDALDVIREAKRVHPDHKIIVSTLDLPSSPAQPLSNKQATGDLVFGFGNIAKWAESYWRGELDKIGVAVLDLAELVCDAGRENFYNAKTWYFGALPFSSTGEKKLACEILRVAKILLRNSRRKKCLVLDLDGVLWGGVIGEDGLDGIKLADHGIGSVWRDVQIIIKDLARQGVILAINSKNNLDDAMLPFRSHTSCVLSENDFAAVRANWQPKPQNITELARELNIGLDSMVFIDDNPVERKSMRAAHPEVVTPEPPGIPGSKNTSGVIDTAMFPGFMRDVAREFFTAPQLDPEDANKTAMYRAELERSRDREKFLNAADASSANTALENYLRSLEMRLEIRLIAPDNNNAAVCDGDLSRAAQLCAKTNQFNLTTRRYSESDLRAMLTDGRHKIWISSLRDRYGDYGRIAVVIVEIKINTANFDTFLMSCRAMGRGVESAILGYIEQELARENIALLTGEFIPTAKNAPVKNFWADMGYAASEGDRESDSATVWTLHAPFVKRDGQGGIEYC